jgi:hypothetical protein
VARHACRDVVRASNDLHRFALRGSLHTERHSAGTARNPVCVGPRRRCLDGGGGRSSPASAASGGLPHLAACGGGRLRRSLPRNPRAARRYRRSVVHSPLRETCRSSPAPPVPGRPEWDIPSRHPDLPAGIPDPVPPGDRDIDGLVGREDRREAGSDRWPLHAVTSPEDPKERAAPAFGDCRPREVRRGALVGGEMGWVRRANRRIHTRDTEARGVLSCGETVEGGDHAHREPAGR